jgi:formylglycine-generating enzyme required for sulfatase activity
MMLKKILNLLIIVLFVVSCGSTGKATSKEYAELDNAISKAGADIISKIPQNTKITLFNLSSNESVLTEYVLEELSVILVNKAKLIILDRYNLDIIRAEHGFQMSGEVSDDEIISIARKSGASSVISCSITGEDDLRRLRVRTLEVETGRVQSLTSHPIKKFQSRQNTQEVRRGENQQPVANNFIRIEGGTFQMGMDYGNEMFNQRLSKNEVYKDESPVHTVTVGSFFMSKYPVTQKEWLEIMGTTVQQQMDKLSAEDKNNRLSSPELNGEGDNYPIYFVNWYEAVDFCNRLSLKEGLTPAYTINGANVNWNQNANGYRLPTESEWEYAARGGNGSPGNYKYSGSNNVDEVAWNIAGIRGLDGNNSSTEKVGTLKPNGLGLYDMSGNISEWCWDWYGPYPNKAQSNPVGANSGTNRVTRGHLEWLGAAARVSHSTFRIGRSPYTRDEYQGFRLVRP